MGRNNKIELRYFPVDVGILRDKKVRRLTRKYPRGAEFYLYLLCAIYSDKGYYLSVDDQTAFDIADEMHITETEVVDMLDFCMSDSVALFSREMRERYGILTSKGIQQRYAETIRQLKRKVTIRPEFLLLDSEETGLCVQTCGKVRKSPEEKGIYSEETPVYPEETAENPEERGINSDKNKIEENKLEENKKEEISFSAENGRAAADAKERENFLKILLFEKRILDPLTELDRFCAHYEKTGWVDAHGNAIKNRRAALKAWSPARDAPRCPAGTAAVWQKVYRVVTDAAPDKDFVPLLAHFRGIYTEGDTIHVVADDKSLRDVLERPDCPHTVQTVRSVLEEFFGTGKNLVYRVMRTKQ